MNQTRSAQILGAIVAIIFYISISLLYQRGFNANLVHSVNDVVMIPVPSGRSNVDPQPENISSVVKISVPPPEVIISQKPQKNYIAVASDVGEGGKVEPTLDDGPVLATSSDVNSDAGGCRKKEVIGWCAEVVQKYNINPLVHDKPTLPENMKNEWFSRNCDNLYKHLHICSSPVSRCTAAHLHDSEKYPLIAIMAATTTRRVKQPHVQKIALFTLLLPSLIRSLDCGYRYVYVMGYDVGDPFYDSEAGMQEVQAWFARQIAEPMRRNGISITLKPVKVFNPLKKPGPVFVAMAKPAYELGANYFYRVNDDTEFRGRWPKLYVKALLEMRPPFGVVGPSSLGSVDAILTHDFVHRVHMEIFEQNYYPPELTDWWMDDWISRVYGKKRTLIAKEVAVMHHTYAHGQRYEVDRGNQRLVPNALKKGRELIRQWMVKNGASPKELKEFDDDVYLAKFAINQIRPS